MTWRRKKCRVCGYLTPPKENPSKTGGFCPSCGHVQWTLCKPTKEKLPCRFPGCDRTQKIHGYCQKHYQSEEYSKL